MKSLSFLPFPGKIRLLFALFGIFSPGNRAVSQVKGVESRFGKYYFIQTIPGQLPVKTFSGFVAIDHKGHFRKMLTWVFKFGWFSWNHSYIF